MRIFLRKTFTLRINTLSSGFFLNNEPRMRYEIGAWVERGWVLWLERLIIVLLWGEKVVELDFFFHGPYCWASSSSLKFKIKYESNNLMSVIDELVVGQHSYWEKLGMVRKRGIETFIWSPQRATKAVRTGGHKILERKEVQKMAVQRHIPNVQCHFLPWGNFQFSSCNLKAEKLN